MENSAQKFDAQVLSRISTLKMTAMNLVEGLLTGQHRSRHKGSSEEFAELLFQDGVRPQSSCGDFLFTFETI